MVAIACVCPRIGGQAQHPDGDEVKLRERLDFHAATTVRQAIRVLTLDDPRAGAGEVLATLTEQYLLFGIESWTLRDELGKPVPVTKPAIRALMDDHMDEAMVVGDAADEMYSEAVLVPLVQRAATSSPSTPTESSTSAPTGSTSTPPTPSSSSSTITSRTDATETISPSLAGVSS